MKYDSLLYVLLFSLLLIPAPGQADNSIEFQFVCSEKLRLVKNRSFKGGLCKSTAMLSVMFFNHAPISEKMKICEEGYDDCLKKMTSKKWKKAVRKATEKCEASQTKPSYTCSLSTDVVSSCIDDLVAAFKKAGKLTCEKLVTSDGKGSTESESQSASCQLIKDTCPEVMEALNLSKL